MICPYCKEKSPRTVTVPEIDKKTNTVKYVEKIEMVEKDVECRGFLCNHNTELKPRCPAFIEELKRTGRLWNYVSENRELLEKVRDER